MMYSKMSRSVGRYPLSLYISCWSFSNHHEVQIVIHHSPPKLKAGDRCCLLVISFWTSWWTSFFYLNNSYSVANGERFVVMYVPCLTSAIMVMLLVKSSNSKVRNCLRIASIFFLKQSVDIVLAVNVSILTRPMQDWKTCWWSSLLITKRLK